MAKTHYTVISRDSAGDWADESDCFSSDKFAGEAADELAAKSAEGTFEVVEHTVLRTYARSEKTVVK